MAEKIYVKADALSSNTMNRLISQARKAYNAACRAFNDADSPLSYTCGDGVIRYPSEDVRDTLAYEKDRLQLVLFKLEELSKILGYGPDGMKTIDKKYKADMKEWRKSKNHNDVIWTSSGGTTAGKTEINKTNSGKTLPDVNPYGEGVEVGTIRYVNQINSEGNGWEPYTWKARKGCPQACASMCLSYIGIDCSPGHTYEVHNGENYYVGFKCGENCDYSSSDPVTNKAKLDTYLDNMQNDTEYRYSPPYIHYVADDGRQHAIVILSRNDDGTYNVVNPANSEEIQVISISEDGVVTDPHTYSTQMQGKIDMVVQFNRE